MKPAVYPVGTAYADFRIKRTFGFDRVTQVTLEKRETVWMDNEVGQFLNSSSA